MEDTGQISIKLALPFEPPCSHCAARNNDVYRFWERATNRGSTVAEIEVRQADN
jgi:hypothetical protein